MAAIYIKITISGRGKDRKPCFVLCYVSLGEGIQLSLYRMDLKKKQDGRQNAYIGIQYGGRIRHWQFVSEDIGIAKPDKVCNLG